MLAKCQDVLINMASFPALGQYQSEDTAPVYLHARDDVVKPLLEAYCQTRGVLNRGIFFISALPYHNVIKKYEKMSNSNLECFFLLNLLEYPFMSSC